MSNLRPTDLGKLSKSQLISYVERGILEVMIKPPVATMAQIRKEDLPEYKKHAHLAGVGIHVREASRKYGVPHPTISRWVQRGIIRVIGQEANRVLIDEADTAYCVEVWRANRGSGRWLFDENGLPYTAQK